MSPDESISREPSAHAPSNEDGVSDHRTVWFEETRTSTRAPAASSPFAVRQVDRYEIFERIGRGGLGDVFRAAHIDTGEVVALKLMRDADSSVAIHRSFRREIEAAHRLAHSGILPIREGGDFLGSPFYVMPLIEGGSLEARLRRGRVDIRWAVSLLARVARALDHAHQRNVLHRDLKPGNILLANDDWPLIADFGLARFIDHMSQHTQTGQLLGSVPYMSPEQAGGHGNRSSTRTDLWSLGVILYEMLIGRRPFRGENQLETLHHILHDAPPPLRKLRPEVTADLESLCLRCLEKVPEDRPVSAAALADDLESWLRGEPIPEPSRLTVSLRRAVRKGGHRRLQIMSLGGLAFVVASVFLMPGSQQVTSKPRESPARQPIYNILSNAKVGQRIPLIVNNQPIYGRFIVGDTLSRAAVKDGLPFRLSTSGVCLYELIPSDALRKPFRLHVKMKQTDGTTASIVGLYAGRYELPSQNGKRNLFYDAYYSESKWRNAKGLPAGLRIEAPSPLQLGFHTLSEDVQDMIRQESNGPLVHVPIGTPPTPPGEDVLRTFSFEITKDSASLLSVRGAIETVKDWHFDFARRGIEQRIPELEGKVRMPNPTGGAGILLSRASASILEVLYESLD